MKTTINNAEKEVDFSKTQLLISERGTIVLSNGKETDTGFGFLGTIISVAKKDSCFKVGSYTSFQKTSFKKLPSNQSVTLQND